MDNILEQIQSLTDKFNNLFEVEGLGEPSGDVPPSTNKIKKDKKTKDGKVELVSVEDELFPKEGNAKEQFRQKVIDKINGMIQGTATLEDLLQLVRSKQVKPVKEGFEGVIELLEEIIENNKKERKNNKQHVFKRMDDPEKGKIGVQKKYSKVIHNDSSSKDPFFDYVKISGKKYRVRDGQIVEPIENSSKVFPMKEAIELLEEIIKETSTETFKAARKEHNKRLNDLYDKQNARIGELFKKHGIKGNTYSAKTPEEVKQAVEAEKEIKQDKQLEDINNEISKRSAKSSLYANYFRKHRDDEETSESFEQSITQIEDLLQCLGESKYVAELPSVAEKVRPQRKAEADEAHAELERATHLNPYSMLNGELSKKQKDMIAKAIDKASRADARLAHANNIINKPKKEEKSSGIKFDKILCNYEEAIEMLEGFFVKDGRGDVIDDMVKVFTKKPIMKHIQDFTKKILKPKNKPEEKK